MNDFTRGAIWATGMIFLVKSVYELGKEDERRRIKKRLDETCETLKKRLEELKKKEAETEEA